MTMHGINICEDCGYNYHKFFGNCVGCASAKVLKSPQKKAKSAPEKKALKLYEVRVLLDAHDYRRKAMLVTILATDCAEAMEHAEISLGIHLLGIKSKSTWTEFQGPFKNGQVLAVREDDF